MSQRKTKRASNLLHRRGVLSAMSVAAIGSAGKLLADKPEPLAIIYDVPVEPTEPFDDRGFVYYVLESSGLASSDLEALGLRFTPHGSFTQIIWLDSSLAKKAVAIDGVKSLRKRKPSEVAVEPGDSVNSNVIFVDVAMHPSLHTEEGTTASPHQIVSQWRKQLKSTNGIQIHVVKESSVGGSSFDFIRGGQIEVRCRDHDQAKELLQTIRQHPQVSAVRWGKPFRIHRCPFCGIG